MEKYLSMKYPRFIRIMFYFIIIMMAWGCWVLRTCWQVYIIFGLPMLFIIWVSAMYTEHGCGKDELLLFQHGICAKKINYMQIGLLVITNAIWRPEGGRGSMAMGERKEGTKKRKFVVYGFLTLFEKAEYIGDLEVAPGGYCGNLASRHNQKEYLPQISELYGSVCWLDYLEELLTHVQTAHIYILEDVYVRFQPDYDRIFSKAKNPIYIITAPHTCRQYLRKNVI